MTQPCQPISMHTQTLFPRTRLAVCLASVLTLTLSLSLSACGGGGSDTAPVTPTPIAPTSPTSSLTQGRWVSTNLTPAYTAIQVPATTGANTPAVDTVWALAQDASTLIKLKANGTAQTAGAVTGNVYTLGTSSVTAVTGGSYTLQTSAGNASVPQMSLQPVLGTTALFDRTDVMGTALTATQANGKWQADLGTVKVNWTVQSAATSSTTATTNLSGTSTSGCTYSGQSTVVATQSLYKVQFTETCSGTTPATQTFAGIGTLNADSTRLTVVATNEAETRAAALLFVKQP
jgi:hypothetical protein